jgi:D-serine deaminase-like pyridoxal phosphate-dependent protein
MMHAIDPNVPPLNAVTTPALAVDAAALEANIARMAVDARRAGVALRPHAKTHKSPDIARMQVQAGAIGIACATLFEAEELSRAGIGNLLITSPVVGRDKVARLARLHRHSPMMLVVDHPRHVEELAQALGSDDAPLNVLVDVDVGQARTGVVGVEKGVALAKLIQAQPRLCFFGLQAYAGHVQHIVDAQERRRSTSEVAGFVNSLISRLRGEKLTPSIISGSGTGASAFDLHGGPFNELQVGSYVFMDADYGRILELDGTSLPFERALFVLATVVSANRSGQLTVDAGTKALAVNGPMPDRLIGVADQSTYSFSGDEHGTIRLPHGASQPSVGARVLIGVTHCDPTANLHLVYHVVGRDRSLGLWPIVGRYKPVLETPLPPIGAAGQVAHGG